MVVKKDEFNGIAWASNTYFTCDECQKECDPDSKNPENWLFEYDGDHLCWDCLLDIVGIKKAE